MLTVFSQESFVGFIFPWSGIRGWILLQDPCMMIPGPRAKVSKQMAASEVWSHLKSCSDTSTVSPRNCSYCYGDNFHLIVLCPPPTVRPLTPRSYPEVAKLFVLLLCYSVSRQVFSFLTVQDKKRDYIPGATACTLMDLLGSWSSETFPPGKTAGTGHK